MKDYKEQIERGITDLKMKPLAPKELKIFANEEAARQFMEKLKYHTSLAPFEISNVFDFLWWVNFTMKWQYVGLRMFTRYDSIERQTCRKRLDELNTNNTNQRQDQETEGNNQFTPLNKDKA